MVLEQSYHIPYNEAYTKYPNVPTPIHTSNYEQETELHFRMRAESFLSKVITENDSKSTIAIVSHGGMIMRLYESFLKLPMNSNVKFTSGDACFHEWELTNGQRFINKANCCVYK
ncbi:MULTISPECIES: histidine phosphatase family protein [Lactobacillus]|uniref:histidine phosphatase family protein n=1 Tax=Lactobacillus TaxID=1578 RepID=UPI00210166E5|nr:MULTISPECIES: histidine phosphatase family protein [Lactobacillus]